MNWIKMLINEIKNIKSTKKELREFGLVVGTVFGILGALFWWRGKHIYPYLLFISVFLVFFGLALPAVLKPIQKIWMGIALIIGYFMTRIILGVLFYLVITPLGIVCRVLNQDLFNLKIDKTKNSYWQYRDISEFNKERYEKQF